MTIGSIVCLPLGVPGKETAPHTGDPDPLAEKVRHAALTMQRESWEPGVLAQALLEDGNDELVVMMARASLIYPSKDGVPAALGGALVKAGKHVRS